MGGGDRHLRDIRRMLERALVPIDQDVIGGMARDHAVFPIWQRALGWSEPT